MDRNGYLAPPPLAPGPICNFFLQMGAPGPICKKKITNRSWRQGGRRRPPGATWAGARGPGATPPGARSPRPYISSPPPIWSSFEPTQIQKREREERRSEAAKLCRFFAGSAGKYSFLSCIVS